MSPSPSWNHAPASPESRATRARRDIKVSPPGGGAWSSTATRPLKRNVAMLARRNAVALGLQCGERRDQTRARIAGIDDVVEVAPRGGFIGVRELLPVLVDLLLGRLPFVQDLDRALRPHHRDLGGGPGDIVVAADMLGVQHVLRAALGFSRAYRGPRAHRPAGRAQPFGPRPVKCAPLLAGVPKETPEGVKR